MSRPTIILTGSHGTGKTVLGEKLAEALKVPFFRSHATAVQAKAGIDPAKEISFDDRLSVQVAIYNAWIDQYREAVTRGEGFIFDRCPIDFAAYLMADVPRDLDGATSNLVLSYVQQCIDTAKQIGIMFLVHPHGSDVAQRDGKGSAANTAYMMLVQNLISNYVSTEIDISFQIPAGSVEYRIHRVNQCLSTQYAEAALKAAEARREEWRTERRSSPSL